MTSLEAPADLGTRPPPSALPRRDRTPCAGCSYTPERAYLDRKRYKSQLALDFVGRKIATWKIGDDTIMKDSTAAQGHNETATLRFLRQKAPHLPTPDVKAEWETNGRRYIVQDLIPGQTLGAVWHDLDPPTRFRILDQVVAVIEQWRTLTNTRMSSVTGGPVESLRWGSTGFQPWGPFSRKRDLFAEFKGSLAPNPKAIREMMWRNMPDCRPWTFSHGDLHVYNIMVEDGELSGIIDFATAGFYPVWWEYTQLRMACGAQADREWKFMLRMRMRESCPEAMAGMTWVKVCDELALMPGGMSNANVGWMREQFPREVLHMYPVVGRHLREHEQRQWEELQLEAGVTPATAAKTSGTKARLGRLRRKWAPSCRL
ncbi:hypothetical protein ACHAQA_001574 [Verticillium albo-atrum]